MNAVGTATGFLNFARNDGLSEQSADIGKAGSFPYNFYLRNSAQIGA